MSTLAKQAVTFAEAAQRTAPNGNIDTIVEILQETNEILDDALVVEGNLPTGHKSTQRTELPIAYWRKLNKGVPKGKSKTKPMTDTCGSLETYSEIDKDIADLNGNTQEFRASEDEAFLEGMNQQMADTSFYGDTTVNEEQFHGLSSRYSSLAAGNGGHIIDAGGVGSDNTSIWVITWGPNTCHYIYPKASTAGLQQMDKGQVTLEDANGDMYEGYRTHYKWRLGLVLRNWKSVVRIANIDVSDLTADASGVSANIINLLTMAVSKRRGNGNIAIYCNETVMTYLRLQIANKANVNLTLETFAGKKVPSFDGYPIRQVDAILNTEGRVI